MDSNFDINLAQELKTTFGRMPNEVIVTSGQIVTILGASCNRFIAASKCRVAAKIYPNISYHSFISAVLLFQRDEHKFMAVFVFFIYISIRQHFKTTYFSIDFSIEQTCSIQIHSTL